MAMDRRTFVTGLGAASTLWACGGKSQKRTLAAAPPSPRFAHGVASGDPLSDRVIVWTRVTPNVSDSAAVGPGQTWKDGSLPVHWAVARDPAMKALVATGETEAAPARDFTVKVDVDGLEAGTTYYYQFTCQAARSVVGRTKTLPVGRLDRLRLAFCSCSSLPWGFFHAYAELAKRADLDAVLHLGDYIYEHGNAVYGDGTDIGRIPRPDRELITLADYRTRYGQYRSDPDLQAMHQQHPVIAVWDDHELANDTWKDGAENHDPSEGDWPTRRTAAVRAYFEWLPIRETSSPEAPVIYRGFRFGDLAHLSMLDTRVVGRDRQLPPDALGLVAEERSLLGTDQETWIERELAEAKAGGVAWNVIGQQVLFAPARRADGSAMSVEKWDGYPAARRRLLDFIADRSIDDVVILSGDFHSSWALDVPRDPYSTDGYDRTTGKGSLAVELLTPGISAPGSHDRQKAIDTAAELLEHNPHLRWVDFISQGYAVLDLDRQRAQCDWFFVSDVRQRAGSEHFARAYATQRGRSFLEEVTTPAGSRANAPALAPSSEAQ